MKNFIHNFIFIVLPSVVCFVCFCVFGISSFGASASLTLGSGASQSLSSGLSSIFDLSSISASPDPLGISIGLSRIYDNLDQYLYQNYDYDLTGTLNDTLEGKNELLNSNMNISADVADSFVSKLSGGIYSGVQQLTGAGYALYKGITNGLSQAKDTFFLGKAQDGVITETLGGALTYVDDNTLSMYEGALKNSISNNLLQEFSKENSFLYGRNFHFVYGSWENYTIQFGENVAIGSLYQSGNGYWSVGICSKYTYNEHIPCSGVVVSGRSHIIDYAFLRNSNVFTVTLGNDIYYGQDLGLHCTDGTTYYPYDSYRYGDLSKDMAIAGTSALSGVYSLSPDIEAILQQLLGELKGHYVSTSDLEALVDSLSNNGVITNDDVVIDGVTENVPVIDWSQDYIDTLQGIIEGILENSAVYDDVISDSNSVTPDPDPGTEYNNQGITIPPGFDNGLFSNTFSVFNLPFNFFSIFEPIFYSFGSFAMMFGLFQFIPFALIVLVLIWVLK